MMRIPFFVLSLAAGCATGSEIGPYVKNVTREGAWLAVQRCTIVMQGDSLSEGTCSVDHVPLAQMPMGPPGPPQAAQSITPKAASIAQTSNPSRKRP